MLRITDPEYEGGLDPAKDAINTFDVIPNVSPTATAPPPGVTGIALARLDIPASTGTITAGMIRDLRNVANPRRERSLRTAYPHTMTKAWQDDDEWHTWPPEAQWKIDIPLWATKAIIVLTLAGLRLDFDNVYGVVRLVLGDQPGEGTVVDDDQARACAARPLSLPTP